MWQTFNYGIETRALFVLAVKLDAGRMASGFIFTEGSSGCGCHAYL